MDDQNNGGNEPEDQPAGKKPSKVKQLLRDTVLELKRLGGAVTNAGWARAVRAKAGARYVSTRAAFQKFRSENPKRFKQIVGGVAGLIVVGLGILVYLELQPKPLTYSFIVTPPQATPMVPGAVPDPLRFQFSGSVAKLDQVGKVVTRGIRMTPVVDGEWRWVSDTLLEFRVRGDWPVGETFRVRFEKSLFPEHLALQEYAHDFETAPLTAQFSSSEFYQDPKAPKIKRVVATVKFSHPVDPESFEKRVELEYILKTSLVGEKAKLAHTVSYDAMRGEAYITTDVIAIPPKDSRVVLKVGKGVRSSRGGRASESEPRTEVPVPGMFTYFRSSGMRVQIVRNERFEPEQVLMLEFTAPVHSDEVKKKLSVYLLPVDKPATPGSAAIKKYSWPSANEVGPEVLKLSQRLSPSAIPTELEFSTAHAYRIKVEPGRRLYVKLEKGVVAYGDYVLSETADVTLRVPPYPKELSIMHDGAVLSLSGSRKLSVLARNVPNLEIEVGRLLPAQLNHLITQSGGTFASPEFTNYQFGEENIVEREVEHRDLGPAEPGATQYTAIDFAKHMTEGRRGMFFLRVSGWDPVQKRRLSPSDRRFVLVTDMGVLVKREKAGTQRVFVQSIATGRPVADATVEVLGKNGIAVATTKTDAEGQAKIPVLDGLQHERMPVAYAVRKGSDLSFLPFSRSDRELAFSRFDVGGLSSDVTGDKLTAYLFSDRGIYRPGDPAHVGLIVRSESWADPLSGIPLEASITDPRGVEVYKKKIALSASGFEEVEFTTEETSPTGAYNVNLYIIKDGNRASMLGTTALRVEEFLPDRMRITTRLSKERTEGWVKPEDLKAKVTLKTLFGIAAADRRVRADLSLAPAAVAFRPYKEFRFYDPAATNKSFDESLGEQQSNGDGEAEFDLNLSRFDKSTYRLTVYAEGYEADAGRGVSAAASVIVSPLDHMVGFKPDGDLNYVKKGSARFVDFVAVDAELKPTALSKLSVSILESKYVSALVKQPNGTYKYQSVRRETTLSKKPFALPAKPTPFQLPSEKAGDFVVLVQDENNAQLARVEYGVAGDGNVTRDLERNAELQLRLAKSDVSPGEEIEMQIVAPYAGAGLITIERERVFAHKWFTTDGTSTVQRITLPREVEGNGYVTVTMLRSQASKEIFMSPLSYSAMPFSVSRAGRTNKVDLDVADRARPGEPFKIRYKTSKPGRIAVFAVDEGILQVAQYKTPDPLSHFFRKKSLEVTTAQMLDQILPEFAIVKELAAPGGGDGEAALGKNLNPFKRKRDKPVAYWSGLRASSPEWSELVYDVPDHFNGTLRVMAVVVSENTIGVDEKKSFIRGPFVLTPTVPLFVAPGDTFQVSVSVANLIEGSKQTTAEIAAETSKHLQIVGNAKQSVSIAENAEATVHFSLKATDVLGSGNFTVRASSGDKKSKASTDLSVRPPIPYFVRVRSGQMDRTAKEFPVERDVHTEFRKAQVALSHVPLSLARGLLVYLENYPYLCTEQLVSKAFPLLAIRKYGELGDDKKASKAFDEAIVALRARQNAEGAFGFWAANSHVSNFQVAYATHFLLDATDAGLAVPKDLLSRAIEYLKTVAMKEEESLEAQRVAAYATYLIARAGIVPTNYVSAVRQRLQTWFKDTWPKDSAAIYLAGAYALMQQKSEAVAMLRRIQVGEPVRPYYDDYYDGAVRDSAFVYIVSRHVPERAPDIKLDSLMKALSPLWNGGYNTLNSSYAILALTAYAAANPNATTLQAKLDEAGADGKYRSIRVPGGLFPKMELSPAAKKLRIDNPSDFPLFYGITEAGFDKRLPAKAVSENLEVLHEFVDVNGKTVTEASVGDQLEVHVKLRSLSPGSYSNVAVVDLLPGGFEPVIESIAGHEPVEVAAAEGEGGLDAGDAPEETEYREPDSEGGGEGVEGVESGEGMDEAPVEEPEARHVPRARRRVFFAGPGMFDPGVPPSSFNIEYADAREDRVVFFGSVSPTVTEIVYRVRATNEGKYVIPPAFGEGMYDRSVHSLSTAGTFTVKGH